MAYGPNDLREIDNLLPQNQDLLRVKRIKNTNINYQSKLKFNKIKNIITSTYNVRSLFKTGKFHELCSNCYNNNIDFVTIQEHKWITDKEYDITKFEDKYTFIYSSADKKRNGGVGILVHKRFMNHIINITKVSDRIISISINSNPTITIASVYAPTEAANKETKTVFYNNLCNFASLIPQHNFLLISGDFNAHIGFDSHILSPKIIGKNTFYKETNNNGKKLVSFCQFESLIPAQLKFIHKQARTYTWTHPNGALAQLDFILVRNKWKNSVTNCRAYNKIEIGSDHRICIAKIRISLRTTKIIKNIRPIIDWKSVT